MKFSEVTEEGSIRAVWRKLGNRVWEVFWCEEMDEDRFIRIFRGASHLYEVFRDDGSAIGVMFFYAENRTAVKFGGASYSGRAKLSEISEAVRIMSADLFGRGVRALIAEVPAGKTAVRRILPRVGFAMCGCVPNYYGDEGMTIFVMNE